MPVAATGSVYCYFAGEGTSDDGLIPIIESTLYALGFDDVNVIPFESQGAVNVVLGEIFAHFPDCALVFVHRDSDNVDPERRRSEVLGGAANVNLSRNQEIIPIVPVKESESWLLYALNNETYASQVGFKNCPGIPSRKEISTLRDAKEALKELCERRSELIQGGRRRRSISFPSQRRNLFAALDRVDYLSGCQSFEDFYKYLESRLIPI